MSHTLSRAPYPTTKGWSEGLDLNQRPTVYKPAALTAELPSETGGSLAISASPVLPINRRTAVLPAIASGQTDWWGRGIPSSQGAIFDLYASS